MSKPAQDTGKEKGLFFAAVYVLYFKTEPGGYASDDKPTRGAPRQVKENTHTQNLTSWQAAFSELELKMEWLINHVIITIWFALIDHKFEF